MIVADHDSRAYGDQLVPIKHFHIPAVIVGKGIEHYSDDRLVSQIDLPQTLLSLIGIDSKNPMIGHDLTKEIQDNKLRAMMQFYKNFAWMDERGEVVILQPEKRPAQFFYNRVSEALESSQIKDVKLINRARANGLWGSLAYKNNYYQTSQ